MTDDSLSHSVATALESVRVRIAAAASRAGRSPEEVRLVAVSKTFPPGTVREAIAAGQRIFGENKVQEGLEKIPQLPADLEWHLIGHLQSNKIRKALPAFQWIQTVDSLERARQIDRVAGELGLRPKILCQVNIGGDDAKFGYAVESIRAELDGLLALSNLDVRGLMTILPIEGDPGRTRGHFARLRGLRDELETRGGKKLPELSMGMSQDFEIAVEEGATLVRVGSAIFGGR
jgi:pyridoxal phosphate enzyme (YggS family)